MRCVHSVTIILALLCPAAAFAQEAQRPDAPVVDTIVVVTRNVFEDAEARTNVLFRAANSIHFTTRVSVVRRELLFRPGESYDSALVAETARNLRRLGIFWDVTIDSVRIGSRLAVIVTTADGWSTQPQLNANSTGGTLSWSVGLAERNLLGTATRAGAFYRDEPDRTATTFSLGMDRAFGSPVAVGGLFDHLSDGDRGGWNLGIP
jgi:outer membrane protein assembly factor BamA